MKSYLIALKAYASLAGGKALAVLAWALLAFKIGIKPGPQRLRLLECWTHFQTLVRERAIRVRSVGAAEFALEYAGGAGGAHRIQLALRVPASVSSDLLVFDQIFLKHEYQHVLDWFERVRPGGKLGTIVDLGGNIGCAALFFCTRFPQASIFVLEPEPGNFARLQMNLRANPAYAIRAEPAAIWTRTGRLQCVHDFRDQKESSSRFIEPDHAAAGATPGVDAMTLAAVMQLAGFAQIDLLKMDVEGAEAALFRDGEFQNQLREKVARIAVEVHEEFISIAEVTGLLQRLGFETGTVDEFVCGIKS